MKRIEITSLVFVAVAMFAFCSQVQADASVQNVPPPKEMDVRQDVKNDHGVKSPFGKKHRIAKNLASRFMKVWTALPAKTKTRAQAQLKKVQEQAGHVAQTLADHVMTVVKASSRGQQISFKKNLAEQSRPDKDLNEPHTYPEGVQRDEAYVTALEKSSINPAQAVVAQ